MVESHRLRGFLPARACVPGDKIVAADDYGDVILQVVEQDDWVLAVALACWYSERVGTGIGVYL